MLLHQRSESEDTDDSLSDVDVRLKVTTTTRTTSVLRQSSSKDGLNGTQTDATIVTLSEEKDTMPR